MRWDMIVSSFSKLPLLRSSAAMKTSIEASNSAFLALETISGAAAARQPSATRSSGRIERLWADASNDGRTLAGGIAAATSGRHSPGKSEIRRSSVRDRQLPHPWLSSASPPSTR